jgi:hypothetical protein
VLPCRLRSEERIHTVCLLLVLLAPALLLRHTHLLLLQLLLGHTLLLLLLLLLARTLPLQLLLLPEHTHPLLPGDNHHHTQLACNPHQLPLLLPPLLLGHTHHLLLPHPVDYRARQWPLGCTTYDHQLWGCREQTAAPLARTRTQPHSPSAEVGCRDHNHHHLHLLLLLLVDRPLLHLGGPGL